MSDIIPKPKTTIEYLREMLSYDEEFDVFLWRERPASHFTSEKLARAWNRWYPNTPAGRELVEGKPHLIELPDKVLVLPVDVDHAFQTGMWPDIELPYRLLREPWGAVRGLIPIKGIHWAEDITKYRVQTYSNGKMKAFGSFADFDDALITRVTVERCLAAGERSAAALKPGEAPRIETKTRRRQRK